MQRLIETVAEFAAGEYETWVDDYDFTNSLEFESLDMFVHSQLQHISQHGLYQMPQTGLK